MGRRLNTFLLPVMLFLPACLLCGETEVRLSGTCVPIESFCDDGTNFDAELEKCVAVCAKGSVATPEGCLPAFQALPVDIVEAQEPNENIDNFPEVFLETNEEEIILGGFLDTGEDIDSYLLRAPGRTRLLIEAFSSGLAASFLLLEKDNDGFLRVAPTPKENTLKREVILPNAGEYFLLIGKSAALAPIFSNQESLVPPPGKEEYRIVLRSLLFPAEEELEEVAQNFSLAAEEVQFFTQNSQAGELLEVVSKNLSSQSVPIVSLFSVDGLFFGSGRAELFRFTGSENILVSFETEQGEGGEVEVFNQSVAPQELGEFFLGDFLTQSVSSINNDSLGAFFVLETKNDGILQIESKNAAKLFSITRQVFLSPTIIENSSEETISLFRVIPDRWILRLPSETQVEVAVSFPVQFFDEIEPNDKTAQTITAANVTAELVAQDVDRFQVTVDGPTTVTIETSTGVLGASPDTKLSVFDSNTLLAENDDLDPVSCAIGENCFSRVIINLQQAGPQTLEIVVRASSNAASGQEIGDYILEVQ